MLPSASLVPTHLVCVFWERFAPLIRKAMVRGDLGKFEEVERQVFDGEALLWVNTDAALITQVGIVESGKVCTIVACGGALPSLDGLQEIESYARSMGCRAMRIMGRKGWVRKLKDYRQMAVVIEKEI